MESGNLPTAAGGPPVREPSPFASDEQKAQSWIFPFIATLFLKRFHAEEDRSTPLYSSCQALNRIPALSQLGPVDLKKLASICTLRELPQDLVLAEAGAAVQEAGFVLRGAIGMAKPLPGGGVHMQGLLLTGDFFGQVLGDPPAYRLEVLADTTVAAFERSAIKAMVEVTPALERLLMAEVLDELDAARATLLMLSGQKATERLACLLLVLLRKSGLDAAAAAGGKRIQLDIPIGRRALASYLGTRPETLSRAIHSLADDGIIGLIADRRIELRDLPELAKLAGMEPEELDETSLRRV